MDKINFQNGVTKVNADTFNTFQNNVEKSAVVVSSTQPTTNEKVWINNSDLSIRVKDSDNTFKDLLVKTETDISANKTSYVTNITRAKIVNFGRIHFINIACTVSQSQVNIFNTSLRPAFLTELNLVTNNNTTARCVLNTNGNIEIARISSSSEVIYVNGIVII